MAIKVVINPDVEVSQNLGHYLFIQRRAYNLSLSLF